MMASTALLDEIRQLSLPERLQLLDEIWLSIADDERLPIPDEQKRLLDQRLPSMGERPEKGLTWREVVEDIEGK